MKENEFTKQRAEQLKQIPDCKKFNKRMEKFSDLDLNKGHKRALEDIRTQHNRMMSKAEEFLKKWEEALSLLQATNKNNQNYKQKYIEAQEQFFETRQQLDRRNEVIRLLKGTN